MGARHADRIVPGLGADEKRLAWGVRTVREACERVGRDPAEVTVGPLMSVAATPDLELARSLVGNIVASSARFSSMHGTVAGDLPGGPRGLRGCRHRLRHARPRRNAGQVRALTPEFVDRFALVGPADRCVERLRRIATLGIEDVLLMAPGNDTEAAGTAVHRALVEEFLPAAREGVALGA